MNDRAHLESVAQLAQLAQLKEQEQTMTHYVLPETDARLDYDKSTKALYVAVAGPHALRDFTPTNGGERFTIAKTVTVSESPLVTLDYDDQGKLVGVEMLLPH